jgi:hypothetical protein
MPVHDGRRRESAIVCLIREALDRFLALGRRGRRGASSRAFGSARGHLQRQCHGKVVWSLLALMLTEEKGGGKKGAAARGMRKRV